MRKSFLLLLLLFCACNNDDKTEDPVLCTEEARPAIEVTVKDVVNSLFLVEGIKVSVIDGEYIEILENVTGTNIFVGAYERTGTYRVVVSKEGYNTITSEPIIVSEDICHVITENVEILLGKE